MYSCLCNTSGPLLDHRNRYNVHSLFLFARDDVSAITTSVLRKYASENKNTLGHGVLRHSPKQGCPTFFLGGPFLYLGHRQRATYIIHIVLDILLLRPQSPLSVNRLRFLGLWDVAILNF